MSSGKIRRSELPGAFRRYVTVLSLIDAFVCLVGVTLVLEAQHPILLNSRIYMVAFIGVMFCGLHILFSLAGLLLASTKSRWDV
jgi:predicted tellurium resistance membrane protein TerC